MSNEPLDLGKKVFFLHPPPEFQDIVIPMLSSAGYELYQLSSYKHAKAILKEYPDSVFYICIDQELLIDQWYNYVSSFSNDGELSQVIIGIMATYAGKNEKNHFLLNTLIPGGFVALNQEPIVTHDYIHSILMINNAKGKRNFVRAFCEDQTDVFATYKVKGHSCPLRISNISSAGLLCVAQKKLEVLFQQNKNLTTFSINLRGQNIDCNVTVFRTYSNEDKLFIVLLFTEELSYLKKASIDMYVRTLLQERIDKKISTLALDNNNYTEREKSAVGDDSGDAFLISLESDTFRFDDD